MKRLAAVLARIPKPVLFAAAGLIQVALIALMVADRIMILRTGRDVTLQTQPVDPRDFLRGDYVTLSYAISSVPSGDLKDVAGSWTGLFVRPKPTDVFVKLAPNRDGFYEAVSAHATPVDVADAEVLIRGRVRGGIWCSDSRSYCRLNVRYGIESYFVPEGEGGKLEAARNQRKLTVVAAVAPTGHAAIKRLLIDGEPVYEEPWF